MAALSLLLLVGCTGPGESTSDSEQTLPIPASDAQTTNNPETITSNDEGSVEPTLGNAHTRPASINPSNYDALFAATIELTRSSYIADMLAKVESSSISWEDGLVGYGAAGTSRIHHESFSCAFGGTGIRQYSFSGPYSTDFSSTLTFSRCETGNANLDGTVTLQREYKFAGHGSTVTSTHTFDKLQTRHSDLAGNQVIQLLNGSQTLRTQVTGFEDQYSRQSLTTSYTRTLNGQTDATVTGAKYQQDFSFSYQYDANTPSLSESYFREQGSLATLALPNFNDDTYSLMIEPDFSYAITDEGQSTQKPTAYLKSGSLQLTAEDGSSLEFSANPQQIESVVVTITNSAESHTLQEGWQYPAQCEQQETFNHKAC